MARLFPSVRALLWSLLALAFLSMQAGADEAQDIAREIGRITDELDRTRDRQTGLKAEQREISEFQTQVWDTWLSPWNRTVDAIKAQKRAINGAIGGQNTRAMYDHLNDLEAELDPIVSSASVRHSVAFRSRTVNLDSIFRASSDSSFWAFSSSSSGVSAKI